MISIEKKIETQISTVFLRTSVTIKHQVHMGEKMSSTLLKCLLNAKTSTKFARAFTFFALKHL